VSSLQVRELPENIYHQLKSRAEADHRSLAQEAVAILAKGLKLQALQNSVELLYYNRLQA